MFSSQGLAVGAGYSEKLVTNDISNRKVHRPQTSANCLQGNDISNVTLAGKVVGPGPRGSHGC